MGYLAKAGILRELQRSYEDGPSVVERPDELARAGGYAVEGAINADVEPVEPSPDDIVLILVPQERERPIADDIRRETPETPAS